jgi:hypothetical protein
MPELSGNELHLTAALRRWFTQQSAHNGVLPTLKEFFRILWQFLLDSLPSRRRQRYGDVDYDWDHRVDTTSATVGWRNRLLGLLNSPYQPTDPALFQEMLASLSVDFRNFTFIDIGSGKGRTLLMASDYPFRRIIGIELLPELHRVAEENIRKYKSDSQRCLAIESICADARKFVFPPEPTLIYLFNPLPEPGLMQVISDLEHSSQEHPRAIFVLYHNPVLEHVLAESKQLTKIAGTTQYSVFSSSKADL